MRITDDRLREIAETVLNDPEEMGKAINELAMAILDTRAPDRVPALTQYQRRAPVVGGKRMSAVSTNVRTAGKPIPEDCRTDTCPKCGEGVVIFKSRKPPFRDYKCDSELGEYQGRRVMLTGANWLHVCEGER